MGSLVMTGPELAGNVMTKSNVATSNGHPVDMVQLIEPVCDVDATLVGRALVTLQFMLAG
jgi:hypothetical protein